MTIMTCISHCLAVFVTLQVTSCQPTLTLPSKDFKKMEEYHVVPDIIPEVPAAAAIVKYGNLTVNMGNELTPTQVHDKPTISWPTEDGAFYTLIMNDPDIPPHIGAKEVQHWLVVNIPGNEIENGVTLFDYVGSGPPEGSGLHRYIFLIFKQVNKLDVTQYSHLIDDKLGRMATRLGQTVNNLREQLKLDPLVASNFYRAQYDENVPKFRQEGSGLHRYIFLIYKQPNKIEQNSYSEIKDLKVESRRQYILKDLLSTFKLKNLVAGNFYRAQYDENVPRFHAERRKKYEKQ